jgi:hypothetical protein
MFILAQSKTKTLPLNILPCACPTSCVATAFCDRLFKERLKGGIEVTERRGRRRRKLLDYLKEGRGCSHLKEEAPDRTMWRAGFERGFGPVVR